MGNIKGLQESNSQKQKDAEQRVLDAINTVRKSNKPFTLAAVCEEAEISRSYFTKHPEMMEIVNRYRKPTGRKRIQTQDSKDTLILSLKAENKKLRNQLKAIDINDNYKQKYDDALIKIATLEKQLKQALESNIDLDF